MNPFRRINPGRPDRAVHGYVYYRWTPAYIRVVRAVLDRPWLGPLRRIAGEWLEQTHHAKVIPSHDARRLITLDAPIEVRDAERVVPFAHARDLILDGDPTLAVAPCACRAVAGSRGEYDGSCGAVESCIYIGDPIASFVAEKQTGARLISSAEALSIVERAAALGNVHTLWFKDAAGSREYALCNCCSCCCIGLRSYRAGFRPLAGSGSVVTIKTSACTGCGACVDACVFNAIELREGTATVDSDVCQGCGICISRCPADCIESTPDATVEAIPWPIPDAG
jgi:ferredoxin